MILTFIWALIATVVAIFLPIYESREIIVSFLSSALPGHKRKLAASSTSSDPEPLKGGLVSRSIFAVSCICCQLAVREAGNAFPTLQAALSLAASFTTAIASCACLTPFPVAQALESTRTASSELPDPKLVHYSDPVHDASVAPPKQLG